MGLNDQIKAQQTKADLVADCTKLIDDQVAAKNGISGLALKATYGVVKGIGANYVSGAIERILPDVLNALDPIWDEGMQTGNPVEHLAQNRSRTADMVLSVTDARIEKSNNGVVRGAYSKLRKSVKSDVEDAVPDLAKIINRHAQG
ncbi:MAG: hypothetical protein IGS50_19185 [Synechococcales cyanobacterium C42_A2020_086]|jgi:hypothetical protein|nr:hypothetical protein [Synechococcales cyanobacterium M58_A2018_015]MBF2075864.1 hypothetical protein [Synechococcales cyanobacterium C42_A2020_086]